MQDIVSLVAENPPVFVGVVFVFSLLVGSFLNVVIHRLPIMMHRYEQRACRAVLEPDAEPEPEEPYNLVVPRSACPGCGHAITALENIPVVSWLVLGGRCRGCKTRISPRYPLVELLTGVASAIVAVRFGFGWTAAAGIVLTWALIALSAIDIDTQLLPDDITLPLLWLGLLLSAFHGSVDSGPLFVDPRSAIVGGAAGYLTLWSVYQAFKLATGKEGMGFGDFKLLAALGAWLGWQMLPLIILLSAVVGALFGIAMIIFARHGRGVPIPFGPYLAMAGWVAMLWGDAIVSAYMATMGL